MSIDFKDDKEFYLSRSKTFELETWFSLIFIPHPPPTLCQIRFIKTCKVNVLSEKMNISCSIFLVFSCVKWKGNQHCLSTKDLNALPPVHRTLWCYTVNYFEDYKNITFNSISIHPLFLPEAEVILLTVLYVLNSFYLSAFSVNSICGLTYFATCGIHAFLSVIFGLDIKAKTFIYPMFLTQRTYILFVLKETLFLICTCQFSLDR